MFRKKVIFFFFTALCLGWAACKKETRIEKVADPDYYSRAANIIYDNAGLSSFYDYLSHTQDHLTDTLLGPGPYTVMAPDNSAFSILVYLLGYDTVGSRSFVSLPYYIVRGEFPLRQLPLGQNQELMTMAGNKIWVSKWLSGADTVIAVNGARVSAADAPTSNGSLNVIGRAYAAYAGDNCVVAINNQYNLSYFAAALQITHWDDSLRTGGPYTVLAPDNIAFNNRGFASMDSVLHTKPDSLVLLLKGHIFPLRKFLVDIEMDRTTTDTVRYANLNGDIVRSVLMPDTRLSFSFDAKAKKFVFLGKKENYSASTRTSFFSYSFPCGNGIVHTIDKVLK